MNFSPSQPPTLGMFGLGQPFPVAPAIGSADWSLELDSTAGGALGAGYGQVVQGLADIEQCIAIILTTPPGSDPFRPDFACDLFQFLDRPLTRTLPSIVRDAAGALAKYEPRIQVVSIGAVPDPANIGHLTVTVTWQLRTTSSTAPTVTTTVAI